MTQTNNRFFDEIGRLMNDAAGAAQGDALASAIDRARDAIVAALATIERATRETTGAVKAIGNRGGVAG